MATTRPGSVALGQRGWATVRHQRGEAWPIATDWLEVQQVGHLLLLLFLLLPVLVRLVFLLYLILVLIPIKQEGGEQQSPGQREVEEEEQEDWETRTTLSR